MKTKTKILIGYDGLNKAKDIVRDLRHAGLPRNVNVLVLTVVNGFMPPEHSRKRNLMSNRMRQAVLITKAELKKAKNKARRTAKTIQNAFPRWRGKGEACVGSPAQTIVKKARVWKADLVVVGSHNQSKLAKFFLGSVSQKVVRESPCSVRVIRPKPKSRVESGRIVIGVDGSSDSALAVQAVANRIWAKGSSAHLVTAIDNPMSNAAFVPGWGIDRWLEKEDKKENEWIRRMAESFQGRLEAAKLNVSILVKIGDPKCIIVEQANRLNADCIFVGARGLNKIESLLMGGSVSSAIATRARCSVEIVRRGALNA